MRCIDIIAAFELEINKLDDVLAKPATDDSVYWINQAMMKFVKDRFNGNAPKRTSYEQNEKRTRDLINLLRKDSYEFGDPMYDESGNQVLFQYEEHPDYDEYIYDYPGYGVNYDKPKMLYVLNEDVIINVNGKRKDVPVFECTADNFMYRITNSLTDFHLHCGTARPLRIRTQTGFKLLTDKNYTIERYTVGYLKVPTEIDPSNPDTEYNDFEDNIWAEIIKIAAQMYIENQSDPRYKTLTQEVLTQE